MEALKRYRTGGEQKVTVQHVSVSKGGQAIVGEVTHSTPQAAAKKPEDKTPALANAPQLTMPVIDGRVPEPGGTRRRDKR